MKFIFYLFLTLISNCHKILGRSYVNKPKIIYCELNNYEVIDDNNDKICYYKYDNSKNICFQAYTNQKIAEKFKAKKGSCAEINCNLYIKSFSIPMYGQVDSYKC